MVHSGMASANAPRVTTELTLQGEHRENDYCPHQALQA
jgi:hypothetical protein